MNRSAVTSASPVPGIGASAAGGSPGSNGNDMAAESVVDGDFEALPSPRFPSLPSAVAIDDWDDLLGAVKARLRLIVGEVRATTIEPPARDSVAWVQDSVLECVAALDQLHTTLAHELAQRR